MTRFLGYMTCGALMLAAAAPMAQTSAIPTAVDELLVRIDITDVSEQLATHLEIALDELPRSVEAPVDVAAAVCEVTPEQLRHFRAVEQHVECKAAVISEDLSEATRAEIAEEADRPAVPASE